MVLHVLHFLLVDIEQVCEFVRIDGLAVRDELPLSIDQLRSDLVVVAGEFEQEIATSDVVRTKDQFRLETSVVGFQAMDLREEVQHFLLVRTRVETVQVLATRKKNQLFCTFVLF